MVELDAAHVEDRLLCAGRVVAPHGASQRGCMHRLEQLDKDARANVRKRAPHAIAHGSAVVEEELLVVVAALDPARLLRWPVDQLAWAQQSCVFIYRQNICGIDFLLSAVSVASIGG